MTGHLDVQQQCHESAIGHYAIQVILVACGLRKLIAEATNRSIFVFVA